MNGPHLVLNNSVMDSLGTSSNGSLNNPGLNNLATHQNNNNNNVNMNANISANASRGNSSATLCVNMQQPQPSSSASGSCGAPLPSSLMNNDATLLDDFEPLPRDRSNTWPLQKPSGDLGHHSSPLMHEGIPEEDDVTLEDADASDDNLSSNGSTYNAHYHQAQPSAAADFYGLGPSGANLDGLCDSSNLAVSPTGQQPAVPGPAGAGAAAAASKKSTSRRNAWGNWSYADLISKAICSSAEKRLTLAQIYDWFSTELPYFQNKGDTNSSAGWKNSIRHNLSLHSRFVRVQNEGAGKSSWWIINPDAKPGKSSRRRTGSMDQPQTIKYVEKKRGRAKKKLEGTRASTSALADIKCSASVAGSCSSIHHCLEGGSPQGGGGGGVVVDINNAAAAGDMYDSTSYVHYATQSGFSMPNSLDFRGRSDSTVSEYASICGGGTAARLRAAIGVVNSGGASGRLSPSLEVVVADQQQQQQLGGGGGPPSSYDDGSSAAVADEWGHHYVDAPPRSSGVVGGELSSSVGAGNGFPDLVDSLSQSMSLGAGRPTDDRSPIPPSMSADDRRLQHLHMGGAGGLELLPPPPYRSLHHHQQQPNGGESSSRRSPVEVDPFGQQQALLQRISPNQSIGTMSQQQQHSQMLNVKSFPLLNNNNNTNGHHLLPHHATTSSPHPHPHQQQFPPVVKSEPPPTYQELLPPNSSSSSGVKGSKGSSSGNASRANNNNKNGGAQSGGSRCSSISNATSSPANNSNNSNNNSSMMVSNPMLRDVLQHKILTNHNQRGSSTTSRDTPVLAGLINSSNHDMRYVSCSAPTNYEMMPMCSFVDSSDNCSSSATTPPSVVSSCCSVASSSSSATANQINNISTNHQRSLVGGGAYSSSPSSTTTNQNHPFITIGGGGGAGVGGAYHHHPLNNDNNSNCAAANVSNAKFLNSQFGHQFLTTSGPLTVGPTSSTPMAGMPPYHHHQPSHHHYPAQCGASYNYHHHPQQGLPNDLSEINYDQIRQLVEVDLVFNHELRVSGNLDFATNMNGL